MQTTDLLEPLDQEARLLANHLDVEQLLHIKLVLAKVWAFEEGP